MLEAGSRGIPSVFTYHRTTASCLRGMLMQDGIVEPDGMLNNLRDGVRPPKDMDDVAGEMSEVYRRLEARR